MDCPKITGAGVQWLVAGCPALSTLNLKGTKATLTALNIIKERYPYSRIKAREVKNNQFIESESNRGGRVILWPLTTEINPVRRGVALVIMAIAKQPCRSL